jgi:hypothetical protein
MISSKLEAFASEYEQFCNDIIIKIARIRKLPNGKYTILSMKGKHLGTYDTKEEAVKNLRRIEYFKNHKKKTKKAEKEENPESYSSVMRELKKSYDDETINKFQKEYKKLFDEALLNGDNEPEDKILPKAMECISVEDSKRAFEKYANAIDLGNADEAGAYLANLVRFLLRRISAVNRPKSIENLRKKIYYLNEYQMAGKKVPPSSSMGQSLTLLKTILLEHNPKYIRNVLNSIVRHL